MWRQSYVEAMRICLGEESVEEEGSAAGLRLVKLVHEIVRCLLVLLLALLTGSPLRDAVVKCACVVRLVKLLTRLQAAFELSYQAVYGWLSCRLCMGGSVAWCAILLCWSTGVSAAFPSLLLRPSLLAYRGSSSWSTAVVFASRCLPLSQQLYSRG